MNLNLIQNVYAAPAAAGEVSTTLPVFFAATRFATLADIFTFVLNLIIGVGWSLVIIMVALGFVQYVMSKGEKTAVANAQQWLTYSIIGGVGLFFVMVIKNLITTLLGANAVSNTVGGNIAL